MAGWLRTFSSSVGDQLGAVATVGVHLPEAGDPAAELGFFLDEEDRQPDLGQTEGRPQAGDAAADDEALRRRLDDDRLERLGQARAIDAGAHQADRLLGRSDVVVGVRPGALLADVDLGVLEGVHAGALGDVTEGIGVQLRRTGRHHETVEALFLGVGHDLALGGVGAGEHRRLGDRHALLLLDGGHDLVDVDVVADVAAALAHVHADLLGTHAVTVAFAASTWTCAAVPAAAFDFSMWAAA